MRFLVFAKRNLKELIRDPLSLFFCIGMPLLVLVVMKQFNIPSYVYSIENFAPAIVVLGFSFVTLFAGILIAGDRTNSFLTRLFASPLTALEYIEGYLLAILPIAITQSTIFFGVSFLLGLTISLNVILTILILIPVAILFIGFGILFGCIFNDKQVPGVGSLFIQVVSWTSGMWFGLDQVGKTFRVISQVLPFSRAVDLARATLNGNYSEILTPLIWVLAYTVIVFALAIIVFKKKMTNDNK